MTGFVDPDAPEQVEQVLAGCLRAMGAATTVEQLAAIAGLTVKPARPGGVFRTAEPARVTVDDRSVALAPDGTALLEHVVGGVVLSTQRLTPVALPGALAALVTRAVSASGDRDGASVVLTSLRDAVG